ncbi:MAG: RCC1 domain-containing protein, partial [Solirubrobacterales bacterium]
MPIQVFVRALKTFGLTALLLLSIGITIASAATPSVRVADDYACALAEAGTVSCWGGNAIGQLGNGTQASSPSPVAVKDVANAVQIDVGIYGACALITDGTVKCWGSTIYGALGTNAPVTPTGTATTIAGLSGVTKISVGEATICAIISSPAGTLKCWGYGSSGQLGVSVPPSQSATPLTVNLGAAVTDVGVGEFHACAVAGGAMKCWGSNGGKAVQDTVVAQYDTPQQVSGLASGVALASAGSSNSCAVMLTGAIKCWGFNSQGQSGTGNTTNSGVPQNSLITSGATAIGYGLEHRCALLGDSARCFGDNERGQIGDGSTTDRPVPTTPIGLASGVTSLDAGGYSTCAIVTKVVKCWGNNDFGIVGDGSSNNRNVPVQVAGIAGATDIDVSGDHACAVEFALLKCWGANGSGQLGIGSTGPAQTSPAVATTFGSGQSAVAVTGGTTCTFDSGGIKCAGYGYWGQIGNNDSLDAPSATAATVLTSGNGAGKMDGGYQSTCAIPTSGANNKKVYCWGLNSNSVLGQGPGQNAATLTFLDEPTLVSGIAADATSIAVGYTHVCAVVTAAVRCWGRNNGGSVTGTDTGNAEQPDPTTTGISNVSAVLEKAVGVTYGSTCAIVTSPAGGIKCLGEGHNGTLGNGSYLGSLTPVNVTGITGATAIAGGNSSICAVVAGAVKCWGTNHEGQLGNGTNVGSTVPVTVVGITDTVSIGSSSDSFCVVLSGGGVKCWGDGHNGQLGAGGALFATTPSVVAGLALFPPDPPAP